MVVIISHYCASSSSSLNRNNSPHPSPCNILVVGSINADTILSVPRLPIEGETLTVLKGSVPDVDIPGGKGGNQAIACARLLKPLPQQGSKGCHSTKRVTFLGQFGNDSAAIMLRQTLEQNNVEISSCGTCEASSGRGYVFLQQSTGKVSAVVSSGSNEVGWSAAEDMLGDEKLDELIACRTVVLLQREIPEFVNELIAVACHRNNREDMHRPIVLQDIGGEDRSISKQMMSLCDYIIPNQSELTRLMKLFDLPQEEKSGDKQAERIVHCAQKLIEHGANNVLVTLGDQGSILVMHNGTIIHQPACMLPPDTCVVDETGAGDCFRAAFAVALSEGKSLRKCLEFASAAGAISVTKKGAVPSIPYREDVEQLRLSNIRRREGLDQSSPFIRGGESSNDADDEDECPLIFGSRLNSMKDRPDLYEGITQDVRSWVKRQGTIRGLGCVDFNYPQHFHTWTTVEAKAALDDVGLSAGAVCLRYPHDKFQQGAMTHPDPEVRREAIEITKMAAQAARDLKCNEVVVWSAYDGYDYSFQVNYNEKWSQIVDAFRECCDEYPDIKFSLEYKPTDENTRFFCVPSTGAAVLLVNEIDRPNMGLTLDMGHMLMSGENPAQSIAMAGSKLFGVQLNDGYTRLAAEDGLMFGSIHPNMALEAIFYLQKIGYSGHLYFDTFPQRTDPVKEAEYNIDRVKVFWRAAKRLDRLGVKNVMKTHDALGALNLVDDAFAYGHKGKVFSPREGFVDESAL